MKILVGYIAVLVTIIFLVLSYQFINKKDTADDPNRVEILENTSEQQTDLRQPPDYKNGDYVIGEGLVTFVDGDSQVSDPAAHSSIMTEIVGKEATGDVDGDGDLDVAFIAVQNTGGTGQFYYLVTAVQTGAGVEGAEASLLGDRIKLGSMSINEKGVININYKVRRPDEPMVAEPTVEISGAYRVEGGVVRRIN